MLSNQDSNLNSCGLPESRIATCNRLEISKHRHARSMCIQLRYAFEMCHVALPTAARLLLNGPVIVHIGGGRK